MNDELELFAEKTYRLIVRLPDVELDALENAVEETVEDVEFSEVDVTEFSQEASHKEFEGGFRDNPIEGGVSRDVNDVTVLTLRGLVYVDTAADFLDELHDLLRDEALESAAERLRSYDADENPLERVL